MKEQKVSAYQENNKFEMEVKIVKTLIIDAEQLKYFFSDCFGAIGDWFNEFNETERTFDKVRELYPHLDCLSDKFAHYIMDGHVAEFINEESVKVTMNLDTLKAAFEKYYTREDALDIEEFDAEQCDIVFQMALFDGEVIYG